MSTRKIRLLKRRLRMDNFLLRFISRLFFRPFKPHEQPTRILLYRTARIGDFIVTIPAMVALRKSYPAARIVLLSATSTMDTKGGVGKSLQGSSRPPWFDFVIPDVVDDVVHLPAERRSTMTSAARAFIREFQPDVAIFLSSNLESLAQRLKKMVFFRLAGLRSPVFGLQMRNSKDFDLKIQEEEGMLEHNVVSAAKSVYELPGLPPFDDKELRFTIHIAQEARARAADLWKRHAFVGKRVLALFPGASFEHKRWPVDKYKNLIEAVLRTPDVALLLLGAETDREVTSQIASTFSKELTDLTGQLDLMELAAVLEKCHAYIGSDTGPMHLATALGIPTIAIMNYQELPNSWEPWNSRSLGIKHDVPCKGCYSPLKCPIGTMECIRDLPVQRVLRAVESVMSQDRPTSTIVSGGGS